ERDSTLARTGNAQNPGRVFERSPTLDGRDSEIELEPFGFPGQGQPDRMKERLALLPRLLPHARRRGAEGLAIEQRPTGREVDGERLDDGARAGGLVSDLRRLQRPFCGVVEEKRQPLRHLLESIDGRCRNRGDLREEFEVS